MKLKLIENSDSMQEREKFRRGFFYYPNNGVFLSTTDQIHICTHNVIYPEEVNEGNFINAYMKTLQFTKCNVVAPLKVWILKGSNKYLDVNNMSISMIDQLCIQCGTVDEFLATIEGTAQ